MNYFHAYWTRPLLKDDLPPEAQDIELWDFELLTWLLSALEVRRHSPLTLVTDTRGLRAVQRAGIDWVYNGGVSTALDRIPREVDPGIFWAAGKLYAYQEVGAPCVSLDTDAVLWAPLKPRAPVMALHAEDRQWIWYAGNREMYARRGFDGPGWNWDLHPYNAAVVYFSEASALRFYTENTIRFMEEYDRASAHAVDRQSEATVAMLFAEQRLLPMCADRLGLSVAPITDAQPGAGWLPQNPECLHLWRAKLAYKCCPEARRELVRFLLDRLLAQFPEVRPTLARWNLDRLDSTDQTTGLDPQDLSSLTLGDLKFSLLKSVQGVIFVSDPIIGARRQAKEGSMIWSAETITPEAGASFELVVGGKESVRVGRGH